MVWSKEQRAENKEHIKEYRHKYYLDNLLIVNKPQRKYVKPSKEKTRQYANKWREKNREQYNAYQQEYKKKNREKWNTYQREYKKRKALEMLR